MTGPNKVVSLWECRRTPDTREIEQMLRDEGFEHVDAYKYNAASIRIRIVDSRFHGMLRHERLKLATSVTSNLPRCLQMELRPPVLLSPAEYEQIKAISCAEIIRNFEFEFPSGGFDEV